MSGQLRIAAIQHDIVWTDREATFEHVAPLVSEAAAGGAGLALLTETFSTGFAVDAPGWGEPQGGPSASFLQAQAAEHGIWVGGTCPEIRPDAPADDQRPSNTFVLAGPDGTTHRYEKVHPFGYGGEEQHVRAGTEPVTVEVDGLRLSLFVCYDLRFADDLWERAETTDVYLVPANWPVARRRHWLALLQARAIENQAYLVGVNRVGDGGGLHYSGDSRIFDPLGEELAAGDDTEQILYADVSAEKVAETRARYPFLQDRRPR